MRAPTLDHCSVSRVIVKLCLQHDTVAGQLATADTCYCCCRCRWKHARRSLVSCCHSWWSSSSAGCRVTSGTSGTTSTRPSTTCSGTSSRSSPTACRSSTHASTHWRSTFSVASFVATTTATCSAAVVVRPARRSAARPCSLAPPSVASGHRSTPWQLRGITSVCR